MSAWRTDELRRRLAAQGVAVDPLEETQETSGRIVAGRYSLNGVFRVTREPYECHTYAPELSMRDK